MSSINGIQYSNLFQRYFIPTESEKVNWLVQKAGTYALSSDVFYKRVISVAYAIAAVALSFFNAISYLLQIPLKLPLNIVRFDLINFVLDPFKDLNSCLRSLLFVTFGMTYIAWGVLTPETAFPFFAPTPERGTNDVQELRNKISRLDKEREALIKSNQELEHALAALATRASTDVSTPNLR